MPSPMDGTELDRLRAEQRRFAAILQDSPHDPGVRMAISDYFAEELLLLEKSKSGI